MTGRRAPVTVWWLSPVVVTLIVVLAAVIPTALIPDQSFRAQWRTPKSISIETCLLFTAGGLVLALAALVVAAARPAVPRPGRWPDLRPPEVSLLRRASSVLVVLTALGYLAFVAAAVQAGVGWDELRAIFGPDGLTGAGVEERVGTIPGVTTLTQFGLAVAVVSSLLLCQRFSTTEALKLALVIALAVPRAFLFTERLAILELAVPVVVLAAARLATTVRGRRAVRLIPVVAAPVLFAVFALFEYTRSWQFYRATTDVSFPRFAAERLAGYYTTALNNGQLELLYTAAPGRWPYTTIEALWTAPGVARLHLHEVLSGGPDPDYEAMLARHANPEFNNASGLAPAFVDYGTIGGLLYFLVIGVVAGLLYRGLRESRPTGMLLYPLLFVGLLELPRYLHWAQGRALPAYLALGTLALLLHRAARRREKPGRQDIATAAAGSRAQPIPRGD
jgi:hypothetical protein